MCQCPVPPHWPSGQECVSDNVYDTYPTVTDKWFYTPLDNLKPNADTFSVSVWQGHNVSDRRVTKDICMFLYVLQTHRECRDWATDRTGQESRAAKFNTVYPCGHREILLKTWKWNSYDFSYHGDTTSSITWIWTVFKAWIMFCVCVCFCTFVQAQLCVCLMLGVCNYGQIIGKADGMKQSLMGLSSQLPS